MWWKKKKENQFLALLALDDLSFARAVSKFYTEIDAATRAHSFVAYVNLLSTLSGVAMAAKHHLLEPTTIEDFIRVAVEQLEKNKSDEVNSRRWAWFVFAALLARIEKCAQQKVEINEIGAAIWCQLAEDAPRLKVLLPDNVVWTSHEKEWFDLSLSDRELSQSVINNTMPRPFAAVDLVANYCATKNWLFWPSRARIGVIP